MQEQNYKFKLATLLISFTILLSVAGFVVEIIYSADFAKKIAMDNAVKKTQERESVFKNFILQSQSVLESSRKLKNFNDFLDEKIQTKEIEDIFLFITKSNLDFMKLRYIDKNGQEIVRIDRKKAGEMPFIVQKNALQNKSDRYYFIDSKSKPLEKIWYSNLDLNVENGEIEIPYNPTLRAIYPIKHNGEFGGIIIINYMMDKFLRDFSKAPLYDMILCDNLGFTLLHYENEKSWGFFSKNKFNISMEFQEYYQDILKNNLFLTKDFVSRKLDLPISSELYLILQLKKSYLQEQRQNSMFKYLVVASFIFILSIISAILISRFFGKKFLNIDKLNKANEELIRANEELSAANEELDAHYEMLASTNSLLENEKKKYKSLLELGTDGIHLVDEKGRLIEYSISFANMLGYSRKQMDKLTVFDWDAGIEREKILESINSLIHTPAMFVTKHKRQDGSIIDVQISARGVVIDGQTYLYASARDISEEIAIKNSLRELNELLAKKVQDESSEKIAAQNNFETLFRSAPFAVLIHQIDWENKLPKNFIDANEAACEIFGRTKEELLKMSSMDVIPSDFNIDRVQKNLLILQEKGFEVDNQIIFSADGQKKYIERTSILKEIGGVQSVFTILRDLTQSVLARKQEQRLLSNLQLTQEIAKIGSFEHNLIKNTTWFSPWVYEIFEIDKNITLNMNLLVSFIEEQEREKIRDEIEKSYRLNNIHNIRFAIISAKGVKKYISMDWKNEIDENENVVKSIGTLQDVTQKILLEQKNFQNQKKAAMGGLIAIIAHQLKQPLNALVLNKEFIIDDYEDGLLTKDSLGVYCQKIDDQIRFMSKSIDELRNFFNPNKIAKIFLVADAIEKSLLMIERNISAKGIKIIKNYEDNIWIKGFEGELQQVIINLLDNAKDALVQNHSSNPFIKIKTYQKNSIATIEIEDNGGGIAEENIEKIFDSYFTTKGEDGTGIGLSFAKMVIEESFKGKISIQNSDLGAIFKIEIKV